MLSDRVFSCVKYNMHQAFSGRHTTTPALFYGTCVVVGTQTVILAVSFNGYFLAVLRANLRKSCTKSATASCRVSFIEETSGPRGSRRSNLL